LHTSRAKGKQVFIVLRQQEATVQALASVSPDTSRQMIKFLASVSKESIIEVEAEVVAVDSLIQGCTQQKLELRLLQAFLVSAARPQLPLQVEDASRRDDAQDGVRVNQDTRLDNRVLDLRTPANQAIFRLEAGVCRLFRYGLFTLLTL
jgi:aspartyl-tRNA synthetase